MALHQTLRSLCSKSGWCYAVLWGLKRESRMLTYEDGYYDSENASATSNWTSLLPIVASYTSRENNSMYEQDGHLNGREMTGIDDQICLAVAKMPYQVHLLGEGIIGRVALLGKHIWMFGGEESNNALERNMDSTWWASQFAAGIKTVAVVAVSQGVVQLGSTYKITEDGNLVWRIRALFATLQHGYVTCLSNSSASISRALSNVSVPSSSPMKGLMITPPVVDRSSKLGVSEQDGLVDIQRTPANGVWSNSLCTIANGTNSGHFFDQPRFPAAAEALTPDNERFPHCLQTQKTIQRYDSFSSDSVLPQNSKLGMLGSSSSSSNLSSSISPHCNRNEFTPSFQPLPVDSKGKYDLQFPSVLHDFSHSPVAPSSTIVMSRAEETAENHIYTGEMLAAKPLNSKVVLSSKCSVSEEHSGGQSHLIQPNSAAVVSIPPRQNPGSGKGDTCGIPLQIQKQDLELAFSGVCESLLGRSWLTLDALDDVDAYVALLAKDISNEVEPLLHTPSQPVMCDELSEALMPMYKMGSETGKTESPKDQSKEMTDPSQSCAENGLGHDPLSSSYLFDEAVKGEPLLEAVIAGLTHIPKSSCPNSTRSSMCQSLNHALENFDGRVGSPLVDQDESKTSVTPTQPKNFNSRGSIPSGSACKLDMEESTKGPSVQELTEASSSVHIEGRSKKREESVITESLSGKKSEDASKGGRKRLRPGEAARPRPKDRQQIQDRVKELRELVPNGSKCSIDALLEKTIKHMHFLQTVTQQGCILKNCQEEVLLENGQDNDGGTLAREQLENGASWALELGGQGMGCPIVVKNSTQPGQLLVEMICDEKGLFLEIADAIRSLGLPILKGVLESRNDKIQARFVVEAAEDMHRVQILLALTQLLQPTTASRSAVTSQGGFESPSLDTNSVISVFCQDSVSSFCLPRGL